LTIVALALLIAIWGVFLGVAFVRKRAEYRADSSIGAFQRQLQVLRRNSQAFGSQAFARLPSGATYDVTPGAGASADRDEGRGPSFDRRGDRGASTVPSHNAYAAYSDRPNGIDRRGGRTGWYGPGAGQAPHASDSGRYSSNPTAYGYDEYGRHSRGMDRDMIAGGSRQDPYFSREACERRRDVLLILGSLSVSTGLISIIPAARSALVLTAVSGFALIVYVALMVRLRAQATEREIKLRYIPQRQEVPVFADRRVVAR